MQKLFSILLAFSIYTGASAQNLTIPQLLSLRGKNLAEVEESLTNKAWNFIGSKDDIARFSYHEEDYGNKAGSFIGLYVSDTLKEVHWLDLLICKKEKYIEYVNWVKSSGCKLINSKLDGNGYIVKYYQSKTTTFMFKVAEYSDQYSVVKTIYSLTIVPNEDYEYIK